MRAHSVSLMLIAFCLMLCSVPASLGSDVSFVHVWPHWKDRDDYQRIAEFLGGPELVSGRIVLRTQPDQRSGCYLLTRVRNTGAPSVGARFVVHIIAPGSLEPKVFTFPADIASGETEYQIGITGRDWPGKSSRPIAWQLVLIGADGSTLVSYDSYLWSKPDGPEARAH